MKTEIRKYIAAKLLLWSFDICPEGGFKTRFAAFLKDNILKL